MIEVKSYKCVTDEDKIINRVLAKLSIYNTVANRQRYEDYLQEGRIFAFIARGKHSEEKSKLSTWIWNNVYWGIYKLVEEETNRIKCDSLDREVKTTDQADKPLFISELIEDKSQNIDSGIDLSAMKPREEVICKMLMQGYAKQEIAELLDIAPSRVSQLISKLRKDKELYYQLKQVNNYEENIYNINNSRRAQN